MSRNLGEINELPALQRIKARLQATPKFYAGETASRVADAHAALDELWKDYLLLNALLDDADALRKRSGIFHDHEAEILELLHGRSITLPMAYVPLAERGLLTSAERADKVTPDELLAAMNAMFALAKDTILELDGGGDPKSKPRFEALAGTARDLASRAQALGFDAAECAAIAVPIEAFGEELVTICSGPGGSSRSARPKSPSGGFGSKPQSESGTHLGWPSRPRPGAEGTSAAQL